LYINKGIFMEVLIVEKSDVKDKIGGIYKIVGI
jgi:hypothetical protein